MNDTGPFNFGTFGLANKLYVKADQSDKRATPIMYELNLFN